MWIIESGRIFGKKTTFRFKTIQIRPTEKIIRFSLHTITKYLSAKEITHHCRLYAAAAAESSILKFQNYKVKKKKCLVDID